MRYRLLLSREDLAEALQRPSSWVLIAVNLGLIIGVIAWDWQVFNIVFLYWVENLVIGGINVLKMAAAEPDDDFLKSFMQRMTPGSSPEQAAQLRARIANIPMATMAGAIKWFLIPFFIVHYGMFCMAHGVFIFAMFSDGMMNTGSNVNADVWQLLTAGMLFAIGLLTASHLFSYSRNFIAAGEYKHTHPATLMMRPYGRIVALHITIIFGAFLTMAFGNPLGLLVVLMILKTSVDLAMHQSERRKFQGI